MVKAIIFGGTTEGRKLCEFSSALGVSVLYCTTTKDGKQAISHLPNIKSNVGHLKKEEMSNLILRNNPALVVDATHPYAEVASQNIFNACANTNYPLLRVERKSITLNDYTCFGDGAALIDWLKHKEGNIFVTTGSSGAKMFANLPDFQSRVWIRILPNTENLQICLDLGYPAKHIICMQGPFSEDLNYAMFSEVNAKILVTKNSGDAGGFLEKVSAANRLSMLIAVLVKPDKNEGVSLEEAFRRIKELKIL